MFKIFMLDQSHCSLLSTCNGDLHHNFFILFSPLSGSQEKQRESSDDDQAPFDL
jgi:hypothetical protein